MKVLSVIIPVFNTELYIRRCLDSLIFDEEALKSIEVIVVSDGSKDSSVSIAAEYKKRFPASVIVVEKENGGHGSTINAGLEVATGKYIKILDSDDWFNVVDFPEFVKRLKNEDSDIVITNYKREILSDESELDFVFDGASEKKNMEFAVSDMEEENFFFKFSMPSMAVKRKILNEVWQDGLLEHTFYVDQQFVAKVLIGAKSYVAYDLDIYRHFIGRSEQSIGVDGFFKHRLDHERVLRKLLFYYDKLDECAAKKILEKQIFLMLNTHRAIYRRKLTNGEREEIEKFEMFLNKNYSEFGKEAGK